jgi:hypothetical protein
MVQCVLSPTQVAEQAVIVQTVDQHAPPPPEEDDVQAVEEVVHHHPPRTVQVSPCLPGDNDVCDRQLVTDEQGDEQGAKVIKCFPPLSYLRRFFPQILISSLSHLGKPPPPTPSQDQYIPYLMTLLHIPQPSLPMVRARTTTVRSLYPHPGRAML